MKNIFFFNKTPISGRGIELTSVPQSAFCTNVSAFSNAFNVYDIDYVSEHWKEDDFFGFQFLNGTNPNGIRVCSTLPPNFPVTDEMVKSIIDGNSLATEMQVSKAIYCIYKPFLYSIHDMYVDF